MLFSKTFFCPADDLVAHELILLYAKGSSVSHRAVYRQLKAQRIILLLILTRLLCSEKGNTVFTDPKDRQVKHYYATKKAVTLSTGFGQK